MDVIGAGFGRTGTLSLKVALEKLGFGPCAHMLPLIGDEERAALFAQAARGDRTSLDKALDGCRATVDWPGAYFWRELIEQYPDAKVVLTVRDPEQWYDSARRTIWAATNLPTPPGMAAFADCCDVTVWAGTFHGRFDDRTYAIKVFTEHLSEVRRTVPAGRLIEYRVGEGWERLCEFLGVPVPDEEFPRLNDTAAFRDRIGLPHA